MFLYLGHLVGVARHLTGVVPYPLVFLRDTGVMNSGQSRITPQKEEKCVQNPQKAVIYRLGHALIQMTSRCIVRWFTSRSAS